MLLVSALTLALLVALGVEALLLRSWVRSIPIRIHVGGTRGKSSVTRYLVASLRREGHRVLGKVTGVRPTVLMPGGDEQTIRRRGPARVQEQFRMVRQARLLGCDAIVFECMSVAPALQKLESRLLRPTLSVLTNILDDHREEYGSTLEGRLAAYAAFLPEHGTLVLGDRTFTEQIEILAHGRGTRVAAAAREDIAAASRLPAESHRGNAALALAACRELGISSSAALPAILSCSRIEASTFFTRVAGGREIRFLNGFAVNDVPSAEVFLSAWHERLGGWTGLTILLNTRADRPYRSLQFARWCATRQGVRNVILSGSHGPRTKRELLAAGFPEGKIGVWGRAEVRDPVRALAAAVGENRGLVVGLGNIAGDGFRILEGLRG